MERKSINIISLESDNGNQIVHRYNLDKLSQFFKDKAISNVLFVLICGAYQTGKTAMIQMLTGLELSDRIGDGTFEKTKGADFYGPISLNELCKRFQCDPADGEYNVVFIDTQGICGYENVEADKFAEVLLPLAGISHVFVSKSNNISELKSLDIMYDKFVTVCDIDLNIINTINDVLSNKDNYDEERKNLATAPGHSWKMYYDIEPLPKFNPCNPIDSKSDSFKLFAHKLLEVLKQNKEKAFSSGQDAFYRLLSIGKQQKDPLFNNEKIPEEYEKEYLKNEIQKIYQDFYDDKSLYVFSKNKIIDLMKKSKFSNEDNLKKMIKNNDHKVHKKILKRKRKFFVHKINENLEEAVSKMDVNQKNNLDESFNDIQRKITYHFMIKDEYKKLYEGTLKREVEVIIKVIINVWRNIETELNQINQSKSIDFGKILKVNSYKTIKENILKQNRTYFKEYKCDKRFKDFIKKAVEEVFENEFKNLQIKATSKLQINWMRYYLKQQQNPIINIPNQIRIINTEIFNGCKSIKQINISDDATEIKDNAFSGCSSLTNITIPNSVTKIGNNAFSECSSLSDIIIPNNVTEIGNGAFSGCTSFTNIKIPDNVTEIKDDTFSGCSSLGKIIISNNVTEIGNGAFSGCTSLASIRIPDNITEIKDKAFSGCSSLKNITIPNSVTKIGNDAFSECSSLSDIIIPDNVTEIGNEAFSYCKLLENITISNCLSEIKDSTFLGCSSIKNITIPNSVTKINDRAFSECSSLSHIIIPDNVVDIGNETFLGCTSLTKIN